MHEDERVPDRYDASVNRLLERADGASLPERIDADLRRFAADHGGLSPDTAGERILGLALRGGGSNRHVMDLQNLATASAEEIVAILSGGEIFPGDVEKLSVHRDRIERLISAN